MLRSKNWIIRVDPAQKDTNYLGGFYEHHN